jgi:hypothetical protein
MTVAAAAQHRCLLWRSGAFSLKDRFGGSNHLPSTRRCAAIALKVTRRCRLTMNEYLASLKTAGFQRAILPRGVITDTGLSVVGYMAFHRWLAWTLHCLLSSGYARRNAQSLWKMGYGVRGDTASPRSDNITPKPIAVF